MSEVTNAMAREANGHWDMMGGAVGVKDGLEGWLQSLADVLAEMSDSGPDDKSSQVREHADAFRRLLQGQGEEADPIISEADRAARQAETWAELQARALEQLQVAYRTLQEARMCATDWAGAMALCGDEAEAFFAASGLSFYAQPTYLPGEPRPE